MKKKKKEKARHQWYCHYMDPLWSTMIQTPSRGSRSNIITSWKCFLPRRIARNNLFGILHGSHINIIFFSGPYLFILSQWTGQPSATYNQHLRRGSSGEIVAGNDETNLKPGIEQFRNGI